MNKIQFNYDSKLTVEDQEITLGEILEINSQSFSFLNRGSLALFLISPTIDFISLYVYCLNHSVVPLLLDHSLSQERVSDIINRYEPNFIVTEKEAIKTEWHGYNLIEKTNTLQFFEKKETQQYFSKGNQLALLLSSSGSTGDPKMVRLSLENIISNTKSIVEYLRINNDSIAITNLPLSYSYGLSILNSHLFSGARIILTKQSVIQREFWDLFEKHKVTTLSGVPYTYEILNKLKFTKKIYPNLKTLTQAGGKLNASLKMKFIEYSQDHGIEFFTMYGQTEATARISFLEPKKAIKKPESIGKPIPNGEMYLIDRNNKKIINTNTEGIVIYKGKNVCLGYALNRSDLEKGNCNDFTLNTGDIGFYDEDGDFFITGREKRFIKINGNRINLDHIENKLNEDGLKSAVIGTDQILYIFFEEENNKPNIIHFLKSLHLNKNNFKLVRIDALPRTESNKLKYSALWERILSDK